MQLRAVDFVDRHMRVEERRVNAPAGALGKPPEALHDAGVPVWLVVSIPNATAPTASGIGSPRRATRGLMWVGRRGRRRALG
jgi:hypothetical protein